MKRRNFLRAIVAGSAVAAIPAIATRPPFKYEVVDLSEPTPDDIEWYGPHLSKKWVRGHIGLSDAEKELERLVAEEMGRDFDNEVIRIMIGAT